MCGDLRPQVAQALVRRADIRQDHGQQRLVVYTVANEANRGNAQAFLIDFLCQRHGARHHPPDIGVMGPRYQVELGLCIASDEHSRDRRDVR